MILQEEEEIHEKGTMLQEEEEIHETENLLLLENHLNLLNSAILEMNSVVSSVTSNMNIVLSDVSSVASNIAKISADVEKRIAVLEQKEKEWKGIKEEMRQNAVKAKTKVPFSLTVFSLFPNIFFLSFSSRLFVFFCFSFFYRFTTLNFLD